MKSLRAWVSFGATSQAAGLADSTPLSRQSLPASPGAAASDSRFEPRGIRHTVSTPRPAARVSLHALPHPAPVQDLVKAALRCPISNELMTDAVCFADGHSYQESVVALAPAAQGAASMADARSRGVPNLALRAIARRVADGEAPSLDWPELRTDAGLLLAAPCLDASGRSVAGGKLPRQALAQSMAAGERGPLAALPRLNLALEGVIDALLAQGLPLHTAVLRGQAAALPPRAVRNRCLETDAQGQSALLLAAKHGDLEAVQSLLEQGASPRQADHAGQTPLLVALERGHGPVVAALAATEQALDQADRFGMFPLLQAALGRHASPHLVGVLAGHAGSIDMNQCVGVRALQAATWVQNLAAMRALVEGGANPNLPRTHRVHPSVAQAMHRAQPSRPGLPPVPQSWGDSPPAPKERSPMLMATMPLDFPALDALLPARRRPRLERLSSFLSRN